MEFLAAFVLTELMVRVLRVADEDNVAVDAVTFTDGCLYWIVALILRAAFVSDLVVDRHLAE